MNKPRAVILTSVHLLLIPRYTITFLDNCSQAQPSTDDQMDQDLGSITLYSPPCRRGPVSQTFSHLEGVAPYRMGFSHKSFIPTPATAVT